MEGTSAFQKTMSLIICTSKKEALFLGNLPHAKSFYILNPKPYLESLVTVIMGYFNPKE